MSHMRVFLPCNIEKHCIIAEKVPQTDPKSFLLGSIAPDGLICDAPRGKAEVNITSQGWRFSLLLRLRHDPWDSHWAIMRASPRVTGQENREAFVRAVCKKKKCWAKQALTPPPRPTTTLGFFCLLSPWRHTQMLIQTLVCIFQGSQGNEVFASAGRRWKDENTVLFVVKTVSMLA